MIDAIDYYGNQHNLEDLNEDDRLKLKDDEYDDEEEEQAIDMDGEMDYEGQYGRYVDNYDNTVEGSI
jgi:hypothetical protein